VKCASAVFGDRDRKAIEQAVAEAESRTAAEIVIVAASRSGRYDRAEDLFGLTLALLVTCLAWLVTYDRGSASDAQWETVASSVWPAAALLAVFIATFVVGTALASRLFILARPLLSREQMLEEVRRAAQAAFHQFRIGRTAQRTGMLIYVSLAERLVWVVGDDRVSERVDQPVWDAARDRIVEGFRSRRPTEGIVAAVRDCGTVLAEHFPIQDGDENELTNELILID
jgi:putative membrane protein